MICRFVDLGLLSRSRVNPPTEPLPHTRPASGFSCYLSLAAEQQGDEIAIIVTDTGIGIPAALQATIFEMFTQVGEHVTRSQGGLGIGLALVKQLVTMHGGSVTVASDGTNSGSRFTVRLPLIAERIKEQDEARPQRFHHKGPQLKVLVIDDNTDVAEIIGWLLNEMGHEYRLVNDGSLARDAAPFGRT